MEASLLGIAFRAAGIYLILAALTHLGLWFGSASQTPPQPLEITALLLLAAIGFALWRTAAPLARRCVPCDPIPAADRRAWDRFGDTLIAVGMVGLYAIARIVYAAYYLILGNHAYIDARGWPFALIEVLLLLALGFTLLRGAQTQPAGVRP